jgi:hypothetical protein
MLAILIRRAPFKHSLLYTSIRKRLHNVSEIDTGSFLSPHTMSVLESEAETTQCRDGC